MARADFNYFKINHEFSVNNPIVTKEFTVDGTPRGNAYLQIQAVRVSSFDHRIRINDVDIAGFDLPSAENNPLAWMTWMGEIQPGILQPGINRVTITRIGNDDFRVGHMVVNWRE